MEQCRAPQLGTSAIHLDLARRLRAIHIAEIKGPIAERDTLTDLQS